MDILELRNFALISITLLNIVLAFVVFGNDIFSRVHQAFAALLMSIAIWSGATVLMWNTEAIETTRLALSSTFTGGLLIATTFTLFANTFPRTVTRFSNFKILLIFFPLILLTPIIWSSDLIFHDLVTTPWGPNYVTGELYWLYLVLFFSYITFGFFRLISKRPHLHKSSQHKLSFVIIAAALITIVASATNLMLPVMGIDTLKWLGPLLTIFLIVPITSAIVYPQLFTARIIGSQLFTALLALVLFVQIFSYQDTIDLLLRVLLFSGSVIFSVFLVRSIIHEASTRDHNSRMMKRLSKINKDLKKIDKLKSDFISIASHQLRTPLSAIKGYTSMVMEGSYGSVSDREKEALTYIYDANERLIKLVNDLLDLSRMDRGTLEFELTPSNLNEIIRGVINTLSNQARQKQIEIVYAQHSLPPVMIDASKLTEAMMNLLDNAIKYTSNGSITIRTRVHGDHVYVRIIDTGIGLTKEEQRMVFNKFERGHKAQYHSDGAGLGLYFAKRILEAHNGNLAVESKGRGKGSEFILEIPIARKTHTPS